MNIIEATKLATEQGKGIINGECMQAEIYLLPTNLCLGFMIIPFGYKYIEDNKPVPRWQPKAKDIIADDWELYGQLPDIISNKTYKQHCQQ